MDYKKVIEDFKSGKIDSKRVRLIMDNDDGYWSVDGDVQTESGDWTEAKKLEEEYGRPNGYSDLVDLAKAAGINCEWC